MTQTANAGTEIGAAATLELSDAATAVAASTTAVSGLATTTGTGGSASTGSATGQAGGSGGTTSASCPLGNKSCTGCGQCGKLVSGGLGKNAQSGLAVATNTDSNKNYQTAVAIESYDANSAYL